MFVVRRVDSDCAEAVEPLGTKPKFWFRDGNTRLLFKAEERGTGEDWAEKIACHLCELIGLPHVHYDLAEEYRDNQPVRPGVVCETCAPPPVSLVLGNQLLLARDPAYPTEESRKYKVRQHTVQAVADVLRTLEPPAAAWMAHVPPGVNSALDVFVGYVMLDAWIANQDRHHENWAALRDDQLRLAPTFDHGAALARNLSDQERNERLKTKDRNRTIEPFATKARSAFYDEQSAGRALGTVEAFRAFASQAPLAKAAWLDRLAAVQSESMTRIIDEVPDNRMSGTSKQFTLKLLLVNQQRLVREQST